MKRPTNWWIMFCIWKKMKDIYSIHAITYCTCSLSTYHYWVPCALFWGTNVGAFAMVETHLKLRWVDLISKTMSTYGNAMRRRASRVLELLQEKSAEEGFVVYRCLAGVFGCSLGPLGVMPVRKQIKTHIKKHSKTNDCHQFDWHLALFLHGKAWLGILCCLSMRRSQRLNMVLILNVMRLRSHEFHDMLPYQS